MNFIEQNISLKNLNTFKTGGNADFLATPTNLEELKNVLEFVKKEKLGCFILGRGSNLLIKDNGIRGVVVRMTKLTGIEQENTILSINAGESMAKVGNFCKEQSLSGFECLTGIPGTIGGAVFMNAGAYGNDISDILISSKYMNKNGEIFELSKQDHDFDYRQSFYSKNPEYIIISCKLELKKSDQAEIIAKMQDCKQKRTEKQPLNFPSAGSTFKRPTGYFAGQLIEQAGLKGYTIGGAQVSEKHAGFVINHANATASDILNLIDDIKQKVKENSGVSLHCEVKVVGE